MASTVNNKLRHLYDRNDPSTFSRIHLDIHSSVRLEMDNEAFYSGELGYDDRKGCRTWRKLPITVETAPLELREISPADMAVSSDELIEREVQVTIECRRRDNNRVFYLDDPENSDVWKRQGNPEA